MAWIKFWPMIIKPCNPAIGSMDVSFKGVDRDFETTIIERMKRGGYVLKAAWRENEKGIHIKGTLMHFRPKDGPF